MQVDRRSAIVAVPIVLLLAVAFLHYSEADLELGVVGNILAAEGGEPLIINGQMNIDELVFSSSADSVSVDFKANEASIKVDGKELKILGGDTVLEADDFDGKVNVTGDLTFIKGDSSVLRIGEITLDGVGFEATLLADSVSFTKLKLSEIKEDSRGFIEVESSENSFDGHIEILGFSGNLDYSGSVGAFFGNATSVSIDSGYSAFYSN